MEGAVPGYYVILENVFGFIGAALLSFVLAPQVYKNWREKSTKGLSQGMILLWAVASAILGIYTIILNLSIPLKIQPQIFTATGLFIYTQFVYYNSPKPEDNKIKTGILFVLLMMVTAGVEVGAIYGIRYANARNITWPENIVGTTPAVLIIVGFIPQYVEIYRHKRVFGISLVFVVIDIVGAFFSVLSLVFRPPPFDIIASVTYLSIFTFNCVIMFLYYFLNWYHARKDPKDPTQNRKEEEVVV